MELMSKVMGAVTEAKGVVAENVSKKDVVTALAFGASALVVKKVIDKKNKLLIEAAESLGEYELLAEELMKENDQLEEEKRKLKEELEENKNTYEKESKKAARKIAESKALIEELKEKLKEKESAEEEVQNVEEVE